MPDGMKFGDIVVNDWAGDSNPQKVCVFLGATKKYHNCLTLRGEAIQYYRRDHKLRKVGELDLSGWKAAAHATCSTEGGECSNPECEDGIDRHVNAPCPTCQKEEKP